MMAATTLTMVSSMMPLLLNREEFSDSVKNDKELSCPEGQDKLKASQ